MTLSATEPAVVSHNITERRLVEDPGYEAELLILALEKTRQEYGDFVIQPVRDDMNHARRVEMLALNRFQNFVSALPYDESLERDGALVFANFPVFLGILGFRTCFVSDKIEERVAAVKNKEELLQFTQGLQKGWADAAILEYNGFRVSEAASYITLFRMVAANRFDLFCRGANEILVEYESHRLIPGFAYDKSMAIYYPLPHFFYAHKSNQALIDRLGKGLVNAHRDGSLMSLWRKYNQDSIDFVQLQKRKIFHFENPNLKRLPPDYVKYVYSPE